MASGAGRVIDVTTSSSFTVFRHLAVEGAEAPATPGEIAELETSLGARLPKSFVDFLAVANGGYLEYVIDVPVDEGEFEPLSFCSIFSTRSEESADGETFLDEPWSAREYAGIPEGVLPFARDGGGSTVYLDLSQEGAGRVVAFVTELPAWAGSSRQESAFISIAASFDDYVSKLRLDREAVLDHLEHDTSEASDLASIVAFLDLGLPGWRDDEELRDAVAEARQRLT